MKILYKLIVFRLDVKKIYVGTDLTGHFQKNQKNQALVF